MDTYLTTAPISEVTAEEVKNFLNGRAFMFSDNEIKKMLAFPTDDMHATINMKLRKKCQRLPLVLSMAPPEEQRLIKKGDVRTGHIINTYTNPESVTLNDIPEHDVNVWSHGQEALLAIYKDLLNKLNTTNNGAGNLIKKAISAIRYGKFSDRCQNYVDHFITGAKFNTNRRVKCEKIISLQAFMQNPLVRKCGNCHK
ncbi:MAG: hypothetical protein V1765_03435 [bacterium]